MAVELVVGSMRVGDPIRDERGEWEVIAIGVDDPSSGAVFCHLALKGNETRQKNGYRRRQVCCWVKDGKILEKEF